MNSPLDAHEKRTTGPWVQGWFVALLLSFLISLMIVTPFFFRGVASGHDFEFHATSWLDVAAQWKTGILYPRWTEGANHGFGEPRFIFYPPISWLLAPALSFVVRWDYVPMAFIVLVQTLAGLSSFAFARRVFPRNSALFIAACYTANPNALLMIYFRSDYAELLASAFFPLLFLATLQLGGVIESSTRWWPRTSIFFAAVFAAVWLSNAPAAVMATYSVVILFASVAFAQRARQPLFRGMVGLALGFGLAAFYIVPAAYEQRWVNIAQALSTGLLPSENFLYTVTGDPDHTFFNYIASTIAVAIIVFTGLAALATRRALTPDANQKERQLWNALLLLAAIATLLMLRPTSLLWYWLPKLRFVQFPWRWMSILTVPFAYFLGAAFSRRRFRLVCSIAALALILGSAIFLVQHTWWDDEEFPTLRAAIAANDGFDGTDEYDPIGDDRYNLPSKAPLAQLIPSEESGDIQPSSVNAPHSGEKGPKIIVERWTAKDKIINVESPRAARLALRLLNYPAWQVEVNGARSYAEHAEDSGQMIVPVPAGPSRITIRFARTPDRTAGGILSLISLLAVAVLYVRRGI